MARNEYHDIDLHWRDTRKETRTCSPLGLIKSISHWWHAEQHDQTPEPADKKKYFHMPTHAASSYLKTTTTKSTQRANEIL